jgi:hypothetical protein
MRWTLLLACVGTVGLILAAWPGPARALDLNGFKVTPSIAYTGEYDDNVFRTQFNKRSDYVNIITPAIAVEATPGKHELKARYKADILRYATHTNLDTERHTADFSAIFKFNRLELRLKDDFRRTDDFPTSELTTRIKRNENSLTGGLDYDVVQLWGIGFDVTWGNINYLRSDFDFLDRNSYTYATNIYYRITAKTRVFGEYNFVREIFDSDKTRDNTRHRGLLGVRGELTERVSLTAKAGYEHLEFRSETRSNQDNFVTSLEGSYRPLDRLQIALLLRRSVESSTFAGNATFESFNATLGVTYAFTPKILIIPRGFVGVDNFRESSLNIDRQEKRVDYLYGGGIGIRYEIQKWIRLDGNYDYSRRDSNFNVFDYDDNRASFTVTLAL